MGKISEEERAAIDEAMARNKVTVLPTAITPSKKERMQARRKQVAEMSESGATVAVIAQELGVSTATVLADRSALGIYGRPGRKAGSGGDKAANKRAKASERGSATVRDRRRFKVQPVPFGEPSILVDQDMTGTRFPSRVFPVDGNELVLKDGSSNAKIGGDVLVGRLKGAYIVTLTLEERATCPDTCPLWRGCYGNVMQHSRRWEHGPELEDQIATEIYMACSKNELVLVRLHVLGDFYSFSYVKLWAELLDEYPGLHVFGFTAWDKGTEIGDAIFKLRNAYPDRFMIRNSGRTGAWGSFTLPFPTDAKRIGDAIVCPEQLDAMNGSKDARHCGNCGVCWATNLPIAFVEH